MEVVVELSEEMPLRRQSNQMEQLVLLSFIGVRIGTDTFTILLGGGETIFIYFITKPEKRNLI